MADPSAGDLANIPNHIDIFIPHQFLSKLPCIVVGYCSHGAISWQVNCLVALPFASSDTLFKEVLHKLEKRAEEENSNYDRTISVCTGYLNCDPKQSTFESEYAERNCSENVTFVLKMKGNSFHIEKILMKDSTFERIKTIRPTVILYDSKEILTSELLMSNLRDPNTEVPVVAHNRSNFLEFLRWSSSSITTMNLDCCDIMLCYEREDSILLTIFLPLLAYLFGCIVAVNKCVEFLSSRISSFEKRILKSSACSRQFIKKFQQLHDVAVNLRNKNINLRNANLLSALAVDMFCGIILTYVVFHYVQPIIIYSWIVENTHTVVNQLQDLLHWLMGVPAGLKLNRPLNSVLGRFFLYHIYLWKTYIVVIKPLVAFVLELSFSIGLLGASFLLCLVSDLFSLATVHIYCFYGYAARLYSLIISGLVSLWRLFRGKKWNPLRRRVDSYEYDAQQLFIGTLVFTVLIFLLPTVALYYAAFTLLRLMILVTQELLLWIVNVISILPVFVICLYVIGSNRVKGDVHFEVFTCCSNTVTLTMKVIPLSLTAVLRETIPDSRIFSLNMEWWNLLSNLLMGKIIYPL